MSCPMSDLDKIKTLGACNPPCPERLLAIIECEFGPARTLGGWAFRDGPYRHVQNNVKWRRKWDDEDWLDHTGEPFSWVTCPWCGGSLPEPLDDEGLEPLTGDDE